MMHNNSQNVLAAFDVLIEEIEEALHHMHTAGASALETRNYDRTQTAIEHARHMMKVCEKVTTLKGEWKDMEAAFSIDPKSEQETPPAAPVQTHRSMHTTSSKRRPAVHQALHPPLGRFIAGGI